MSGQNAKPLRFWNNLCYGLAGIPTSLSGNAINFFFSVFILEVAQITPAHNSILTTSAIVLSSAANFFVGFLVNTTDTRWGKLKPWILLSTFPSAACYFFLWFSPGVANPTGKLIWYLVFYVGFRVVSTGYGVARDSLVMFASHEPRERDTLITYSSAFQIAGIILSALIQQGTFLLLHADLGYDPCSNGTNVNGTDYGPSRDTEKEAYMVAAAVGTVIFLLCGLAAVFGVPEITDMRKTEQSSCFPVGDIKALARHRPFLMLLVIKAFLELGINTKQINSALMMQYTFNIADQVFYVIFLYMAAAVVAIFFWNLIIRRIGRKKVIFLGILVFLLPHNAALLIATEDLLGNGLLPFIFVAAAWGGIGEGCMYIVQSVMCTDVIDDFTLKTDRKMASVFYAVWGFVTGIMDAISAAVSNWILQSVNYNADNCVQSNRVKQALRYITAGTPPAVYVIALLFVWLYPITEESRLRTKMALDARRTAGDNDETQLYNPVEDNSLQETLAPEA
ncbi:sodium-dependent lysophosphatidylcholine symporter 1-A-like isoform X1 [Branchiostoma floridae]|uniref:Sodium-dependent lysophosphatidylcholine symporter 1-A-like isoform X1 n=1 Tax=Branchiostoma floridae TaxID=7739 RepID=A0A9J7MG65_BRAFL|nr:sodium-dependent lysophosphatidylcholine symporter 1-A-like isoform X1 [Branchiostoma floridae]XP_035666723.1 sodium-dependent lysophosphatidylcholine symporter 1-A-like isoform X1 [Branchiostoma floridae]XP_035666724.1 sodium-dependent lysophosphatidylcholine symporter 1-A-like isoform X1 [Branchiostoma floridae]